MEEWQVRVQRYKELEGYEKNNEIITIGIDYVSEGRSTQVTERKVLGHLTN